MKIVNSQLAQSIQEQGMLKPPNNFGYIMLAAEIEKTAPYIKVSKKKKALIKSLRSACRDLKKEVQVNRARRQPREAKSHYAGVMKMGVTLGVMDYTPSGV